MNQREPWGSGKAGSGGRDHNHGADGGQEAAAELLLETKGFADSIVSITDGKADVVVNETQLSEAQKSEIEDVIKRKNQYFRRKHCDYSGESRRRRSAGNEAAEE